jgi:di/tricarboxylate transporter
MAICLLSALLTSLITLNGAVAALLPLVVLLGQRIGTPPSQLLMPVAFAGSAGGLLMLMSSPVNVIVSDAAAESGEGPFSFFSFSLVGIPLLLGTVAICLLFGRRLLPTRMPDYMPPDLGRYAEMVSSHYAIGEQAPDLITREAGVAEVVVPPRSRLVGERVHAGMRREHDLVILAVQRLGRDLGDDPVEVAEGDALLLHGRWSELDQLSRDRDVLLVDSPELVRRQAVPWGAKASRAVVVLAALVGMLASGQVPPAIAGLAAAVAMVLLRVVTATQAYRAVIPLSTAISSSGAADQVASLLIDAVGTGRPYLLLVAMFLLTATLGQVVSNTATVLVVVPIAVAAAEATGTSAKPLLMVVAIAGCAALLTPIATPGNMMIMTPAGYRFGDYWKLGLPVMAWWFVVAIAVVPLGWGL